jgi:hypothetical protein
MFIPKEIEDSVCKKKNEDLIKLERALFFLFALFSSFFGSLRHECNLKSIFDFNLYLKFAKGLRF